MKLEIPEQSARIEEAKKNLKMPETISPWRKREYINLESNVPLLGIKKKTA
jgi:hypothetical protein